MQLPTLRNSPRGDFGKRSPTEVSVVEDKTYEQLQEVFNSYINIRDEQAEVELGLGLNNAIVEANNFINDNDKISKEQLTELGIKEFDNDERQEVSSTEVFPFLTKSTIDDYVESKRGSFYSVSKYKQWASDIKLKASNKFIEDMRVSQRILKQEIIAGIKSEIELSWDKGNFDLVKSLIKKLPKVEQSDFNRLNSIKRRDREMDILINGGANEQAR